MDRLRESLSCLILPIPVELGEIRSYGAKRSRERTQPRLEKAAEIAGVDLPHEHRRK